MTIAARISLFMVCASLLPGCTWMPWVKKKPEHFGVLSVRLYSAPPKGKRVTYALVSVHKGRRLKDAGTKRLNKEGEATFVLPMDHIYDVRIFLDLNHNQLFEPDEPSGLLENVTPFSPTNDDSPPFTLAFGVTGQVAGRATEKRKTTPNNPASAIDTPAEAAPYLDYMPQWLRDKLLR